MVLLGTRAKNPQQLEVRIISGFGIFNKWKIGEGKVFTEHFEDQSRMIYSGPPMTYTKAVWVDTGGRLRIHIHKHFCIPIIEHKIEMS